MNSLVLINNEFMRRNILNSELQKRQLENAQKQFPDNKEMVSVVIHNHMKEHSIFLNFHSNFTSFVIF